MSDLEIVEKQKSQDDEEVKEKSKQSAEKEKLELLFSEKSTLFVKRHTLYKELG